MSRDHSQNHYGPNASFDGYDSDLASAGILIESLRQQLAAALAACKQKDEALKWLMDWQVKHVDVWDNPAFDNAEEALTIQPDDSELKAWLGEPVAWKDSEAKNRVIFPPMKPEEGDDGWIPLYSPKGMK